MVQWCTINGVTVHHCPLPSPHVRHARSPLHPRHPLPPPPHSTAPSPPRRRRRRGEAPVLGPDGVGSTTTQIRTPAEDDSKATGARSSAPTPIAAAPPPPPRPRRRTRSLAVSLPDEEEDAAHSFAERAENYYQKRPQLLALLQDLHLRYLHLADRYSQSLLKSHHHHFRPQIPSKSDDDDAASAEISDAESALSFQPLPRDPHRGPDPAPDPDLDLDVDPATGDAFVTGGGVIWKVDARGIPSVLSRSLIYGSGALGGEAHVSRGFLLAAQGSTGKVFKVDAEDGAAREVLGGGAKALAAEAIAEAIAVAMRSDGSAVVAGQGRVRWLKSRDGWGRRWCTTRRRKMPMRT